LAIREGIRSRGDDGAARANEAISVNNLGVLLQSTARLSEARPMLRRAIDLFHEEEHPHLAAALNNLGLVERGLTSWALAEDLFRQALAQWEATYGVEHGWPLLARRNLVVELYRRHQYDEAIALARETVAIADRMSDPMALHNVLRMLGTTERKAGRFDDAVATLRRTVSVAESLRGAESPLALRTRTLLAGVIGRSGDVEAALAMLEEIAGIQHEQQASARRLLRTEDYFGYVMFWAGRYAEGEAHYRRYLDGKIEEYGDHHPSVGYGLHNVGRVVAAQGRADEAAALLERALDIRSTQWGNQHPDVADTAFQLAQAELQRGNRAPARALLQQVVVAYQALYPEDDTDRKAAVAALSALGG
jgi:tetratricopeptide (TPR) repeat protein